MGRKPIGDKRLTPNERKARSNALRAVQHVLLMEVLEFIRSDLVERVGTGHKTALARLADIRERSYKYFPEKPYSPRFPNPFKLTEVQKNFINAAAERDGVIMRLTASPHYITGPLRVHNQSADILLKKGLIEPVLTSNNLSPKVCATTSDGTVASYEYRLTSAGYRSVGFIAPEDRIAA